MIDRMALWLELVSGLRRCRSSLSLREWWLVLSAVDPVDARVVVLKLVHSMTLHEIGERLEITPQAAHQRWQRVCRNLKAMNRELDRLLPCAR